MAARAQSLMYASCAPRMTDASENRDLVEEMGTPLEPQLKKGIAPWLRTLVNATESKL